MSVTYIQEFVCLLNLLTFLLYQKSMEQWIENATFVCTDICFSREQVLYETLVRQDELLAYIDQQRTAKFCVSYNRLYSLHFPFKSVSF